MSFVVFLESSIIKMPRNRTLARHPRCSNPPRLIPNNRSCSTAATCLTQPSFDCILQWPLEIFRAYIPATRMELPRMLASLCLSAILSIRSKSRHFANGPREVPRSRYNKRPLPAHKGMPRLRRLARILRLIEVSWNPFTFPVL